MIAKRAYDNYLVRTDPQTRKITTMFGAQAPANVSEIEEMDVEYQTIGKDRVPINLASVRELREEVMEVGHNGMSLFI